VITCGNEHAPGPVFLSGRLPGRLDERTSAACHPLFDRGESRNVQNQNPRVAIACRPGRFSERVNVRRCPALNSLSCSKNESAESHANSGPLVLTSGTVYRLPVPAFGSRGFSAVVIQQSAQPLATLNSSSRTHRCYRNDQPVIEALMVPFQMIMGNEFLHRLA